MSDGTAPSSTAAAPRDPGLLAKLGSLFRTYAIPAHTVIVPRSFQPDDRRCFTFLVPTDWPSDADDGSQLVLLEDGLPLGPAHAGHDDIRTLGAGRFSHWGDKLYFSSSDGSDPRDNGRVYSLELPSTLRAGARAALAQLAASQPSSSPAPTDDAAASNEPEPGCTLSVEWSLTPVQLDELTHVGGEAFALAVPSEWPSDAESLSTLMLLEDGRPLPHPHAAHDDIAAQGAGRYSHWGAELRFSSSDGSDPREGRHDYAVARAEAFLFDHAPQPPLAEEGACWSLHEMPAEWTSDEIGRSRVALLENGRLLGPAHSPHDEIRELGGGRYCHWGRQLLFSTSDGSDPTSNGRTYTVLLLDDADNAEA
ncbi:MAG: hypothetical protein DHS20C15_16350 [Planctomycetota bacterium]|nr:MAG: hypothetical protein DHS20C15_16350 [Planctomycetota bacterium]